MENDMEAQREKRPLKHLQGLKGRVQNSLSGFLRACIVAALVMFQFTAPVCFIILFGNGVVWCVHHSGTYE